MKFALSAALGALLVLGTFQTASAGACSGQVASLKLTEDSFNNNLKITWTAPSGESGCTYTVTFTSNAPGAETKTFETEELGYTIDSALLVPCSMVSVSVSTSDGAPKTAEREIDTRTSTAPELLDMVTSCDSIEMTWAGQPFGENMCQHTHFQLFCLSDKHNFTIPQNVVDEENRIFHILLREVLQPDIQYTCNGYMFITLAGFTPASRDIQFWSNLDAVRDLKVSGTGEAIRATWEPPFNSEECGVAYHVTYENEVLGTGSQETENLYVDLDAEIIPCTNYKISVTPIASTGSHGTYVSVEYEPEVTQGSVDNLEVSDNDDSLTVSWTPINVGKCDVKFHVEHYVDDELKDSFDTTDSSAQLDRIPCSQNRFEVSVVTNGDAGAAVVADLNLQASDINEISEVQNVLVSGNVVTWDPPVSVGRCGVTYMVTHVSPFGEVVDVVTGTDATLTLVPCSENTVTVVGVADQLTGTPATVEFVADPADLDAPETLRIIPDFTLATLTIGAEKKNVNSCPITEALVTCSKDGSPDAFGDSITVEDNENRVFELELTGLETDSIYDCTLRWSNSAMGEKFRFRTIRIPNKLVAITDVTPTGFNVVWTEEYGSEFVLSYDLVINSHGPAHDIKEGCPHETENTFSFTLGAGDENQVFVEGFPDFEYDVTLRTLYNLGSLGVTDESESLDTRTLTDAPEAPEDLLVDFVYEGGAAYNVTAFVTWTAPCVLNGALRSFGVIVEASFELGGETHTLEYSRDIAAASVNDVFVYELVDINPFFRYVISVNTLAAEEGPSSQIVITPPDICSCVARF